MSVSENQSKVSVDLLSRLENGMSGVRLDKLLQVLDGLGLTLPLKKKPTNFCADSKGRLMSHSLRMELHAIFLP